MQNMLSSNVWHLCKLLSMNDLLLHIIRTFKNDTYFIIYKIDRTLILNLEFI